MDRSSSSSSTLAGRRVLVAGAGGYIASRLLPRLFEAGAKVAAQASYTEPLQGLDLALIAGPVSDPQVQEAIRAFDPEIVLDLMGKTDQSHSRDNDDAMAESHFGAVRDLGRAVIDAPSLTRWVHCGTNEEYGNNPVPFQEDMREEPVSAYSAGKVAATHHLQMLATYEGVPVCTVRPFVVFGPQQTRGLIPFLIRMGLSDQAFDTTDGKQTRDFIWSEDLVEGMLAAAVAPADAVNGQVINLGAGVETPVRHVVETVCRLAGGGQPNFGAMSMRPGESQRCVADISKAKSLLGWEPKVSLEEGLAQMVEDARAAAGASS